MKKSYKVFDYLDMGIFPGIIMFICGYDYDFIIKHAKKHKIDDWIPGIEHNKDMFETSTWFAAKTTIEHPKYGSKTLFFVYLKNQFDFTDDSYSALAHEFLHICQFFLPDVMDREKEREAEAYLHTYLMKQSLKKLRGK